MCLDYNLLQLFILTPFVAVLILFCSVCGEAKGITITVVSNYDRIQKIKVWC